MRRERCSHTRPWQYLNFSRVEGAGGVTRVPAQGARAGRAWFAAVGAVGRGGEIGRPVVPVARSSATASSGSPPAMSSCACSRSRPSRWRLEQLEGLALVLIKRITRTGSRNFKDARPDGVLSAPLQTAPPPLLQALRSGSGD